MRTFFDTNLFIYSHDIDAGEKHHRSRELLEEAFASGRGVLSTQVLQEYFAVSTGRFQLDPEAARQNVRLFANLDLVQVDLGLILGAIDLSRLHSFSFWDGLIVRAAMTGGCQRLLTEDLQHDRVIDGVRIENPFL